MKERKISELKAYEKNPRKMTKGDFETLQKSLSEHGDLSGVIFNRTTGNLVGGHQRTNVFRNKDAKVFLTEEMDRTPTGTVAVGYIQVGDERFSYREVEWDEDQEAKANILANKVSGQWDFDMLANAFDVDTLLESGWDISELGFNKKEGVLSSQDLNDGVADDDDKFESQSTKHITFIFSEKECEDVLYRLDKIMEKEGVSNHSDALLKLLYKYKYETDL